MSWNPGSSIWSPGCRKLSILLEFAWSCSSIPRTYLNPAKLDWTPESFFDISYSLKSSCDCSRSNSALLQSFVFMDSRERLFFLTNFISSSVSSRAWLVLSESTCNLRLLEFPLERPFIIKSLTSFSYLYMSS